VVDRLLARRAGRVLLFRSTGHQGARRKVDRRRDAKVKANATSVRSNVIAQFERVAKEHNKQLAPLSDDLVLLESGLDSLCLAVIVAHLEDTLGVDPFSAAEDGDFPVTLGDFIRFYEDAAG
jgi:acyl carrier protein